MAYQHTVRNFCMVGQYPGDSMRSKNVVGFGKGKGAISFRTDDSLPYPAPIVWYIFRNSFEEFQNYLIG